MAIEYTPKETSNLVNKISEGGAFQTSGGQELSTSKSFASKSVAASRDAATSEANAQSSETASAASASASSASASSSATSATASASSSSAAATSETAAELAETNAETAETSAISSASLASTSETNAATSETNAATSEANAATSETNAATSEANAASSYDSFDDRYLGPKPSAPTLNNDDDALIAGSLYFNSTSNLMKVWSGSLWLDAFAPSGTVSWGTIGGVLADQTDLQAYIDTMLPLAGGDVTGPITTNSTFDGRDVSVDGTKLDGVEALADVTDTTNVVAALTAGNGVDISEGGVVAVSVVALTTVQTAVSETAHLALSTQEGDVVVRSDLEQTFMHNGGSAGTLADFTLLTTPTDSVTSVDGLTGVVTLNHDSLAGFVANEHVDYTAGGTFGGNIDVTGTATMDGLVVDGPSVFNEGGADADFRVESNNHTQALFVDGANGNVGIGCSPNARFSIGISGTETAPAFILGNDADTGLFRPADNSLAVTTAGAERMRIDAIGNVLFGNGNGHSPKIQGSTNSGRTQESPGYSFNDDLDTGMFQPLSATNTIAFSTGATERMRIDGSGNVLVSTTDVNVGIGSTSVGSVLGNDGYAAHSRTGTTVLFANRNTSDGEIARFSKDGTTVGSIGTEGGNLYIEGSAATGKSGIEFSGAEWYPRDNGSNSDGAISLGDATNRFKDLFLSGTATMGGLVVDGDIATGKLTSAAGGNAVNGMRFRVNNSANTAESATLGMINAETVNSWGGVLTFSTKSANGTPNEAVTERMRIFSDGDVTIGATYNYAKLNVAGDIRAENSKFLAGREGAAAPAFAFHDDGDTGIFNINPNILGFSTAGVERMRIDSSGRLLVGQTGNYPATGGGTTKGVFAANADSRTDLIVSNQTNGANSGSALVLGAYGHDYIIESQSIAQGGALTFTKSAIEHMRIDSSGITAPQGIYLGGTGAANKLDDYEEGSGSSVVKVGGTVVTQSNSRGYKYVKVGNIVTFYFEFSVGNLNGGTGEASIDLPFTCDEYGVGGVRIYGGAVVGNEFLGVSPSSALCKFKTNVNNSATGNMALTVGGYYYGSVTYIVS